MNRYHAAFLAGLAFYVFPALAVVFKMQAVWYLPCPEGSCAVAPFVGLAIFTERYLPAFYSFALPAMFFLLLGTSKIADHLKRTLVAFLAVFAVMFAIPNLTWPLGNVYYETLQFYMGQLSIVLMFFTVMLYVRWAKQ